MGLGKTYSTKYLLDSNNNRGAEGQVLSTTSTGIDWVDANTVPGTGLWLESGNDIYNSNSGNVGIGATNPSAALHVYDRSNGEVKFQRVTGYAGLLHFGFPSGLPSIRTSGNFAIKASNAWGADLYINSSGNVGIGTDDPGAKLTIKGSDSLNAFKITDSGDGDGFKVTSHTAQGTYVQIYDAAHTQTIMLDARSDSTARHTYFNGGGNVGIGMTSPAVPLDVEGKIRSNDSNSADYFEIFCDGSVSGDSYIENTSNNIQIKSAYATSFSTSGSVAMFIDNNQNVGIGTTSPSAKLDVQGTQGQLFSVTDDLSGSIFAVSDISGVPIFDVNSSGVSYFDGSVGIGTTSPSSKLQVAGSGNESVEIKVSGGTTAGNTGTISLSRTDGAGSIIQGAAFLAGGVPIGGIAGGVVGSSNTGAPAFAIQTPNSTNGHIVFKPKGTEKVRIQADGNVGIGVTGPGEKLTIGDTGNVGMSITDGTHTQYIASIATANAYGNGSTVGQLYLRGYDGIGFSGNEGGATHMTLLTGGDVGIGDTTPSYKLDVAGTIRATGDVIAFSDVRVKENIKTIKSSLDKVSKLRGVEFNKIGEDEKSIGVIAQEIEKVIPEVVKTDEEGMKSVAYGNISGLLIEAIKELKAEVDLLKSKPCNCNCKK
jgi:hypothetical protein